MSNAVLFESKMSAREAIRERWQQLKADHPKGIRARDGAAKLGITEAELVDSGALGESVPLGGTAQDFFVEFASLGRVKTITRNEQAVLEREGTYNAAQFFGGAAHQMGQVVGDEIDLRIFPGHWKAAFALTEALSDTERKSLQFFDSHGTAIHKIYRIDDTDAAAFDAFVAKFANAGGAPFAAQPAEAPAKPDAPGETDIAAFRAAWDAMKDTHEFFSLLGKFKVSRLKALEIAGESRARKIPAESFTKALNEAVSRKMEVMFFVGNPGLIQIFTGRIENVKLLDYWVNVLDPAFNLHLRGDLVGSAWIVRKPTSDGIVTSLELFTEGGDNILLMFGKRKPGKPELPEWAALASEL